MPRSLLTILSLALLAACAAPARESADASSPAPGRSASETDAPRRDRNRIDAAELEELRSRGAADVLTVIERARPTWMRVRRTRLAPAEPMILLNDQPFSNRADLRHLPSATITSIEYMSPTVAKARYGSAATFGAIVIRRQ